MDAQAQRLKLRHDRAHRVLAQQGCRVAQLQAALPCGRDVASYRLTVRYPLARDPTHRLATQPSTNNFLDLFLLPP